MAMECSAHTGDRERTMTQSLVNADRKLRTLAVSKVSPRARKNLPRGRLTARRQHGSFDICWSSLLYKSCFAQSANKRK